MRTNSCRPTFIGLDALDFNMMETSLRKLRLSVNCRVSLEEISICGFHVNSIVISFCAGTVFSNHSNEMLSPGLTDLLTITSIMRRKKKKIHKTYNKIF